MKTPFTLQVLMENSKAPCGLAISAVLDKPFHPHEDRHINTDGVGLLAAPQMQQPDPRKSSERMGAMRNVILVLGLVGLLCAAVGLRVRAADEPPTARKLNVLLLTGEDVSAHNWKEIAAATTEILQASGKFDVKQAEDFKLLESADDLAKFDVIVQTGCFTKKVDLSDQAKANLLNFVKNGKGIYLQHLATASFPKWEDFGKLCGRYWVMGKSGHNARSVFEAKIADTDHPITKGLKDFKTDDELYAKLQGTADVKALVTGDSDYSKKTEPLVFVREEGKGRVVVNNLGHDKKALQTPEVQTLVARGVEWAATGKVTDGK